MSGPWGQQHGLNWRAGFTRIAIVAYGLWIVAYLVWADFPRELTVWFGADDTLGLRRDMGERIRHDLAVAFVWPLVSALGIWLLVSKVLPILYSAGAALVRWVRDGFEERDPEGRK